MALNIYLSNISNSQLTVHPFVNVLVVLIGQIVNKLTAIIKTKNWENIGNGRNWKKKHDH